jgi:spore coat protein U-like protein
VISRFLIVLLVLVPAVASAATTCSFSSTPGMAFGAYDDSSATPTDATTSIVVSCARTGGPTPVNATLQIGTSAGSGLIATRSMRSGANVMNYNLYRDSGRTQVWGQTSGVDTSSISITVPNNNSASGTLVIYGRIPALQNVPVGPYSDSVQITISP